MHYSIRIGLERGGSLVEHPLLIERVVFLVLEILRKCYGS
jgi:hypothetical protein